jgi:alkanesulfonate monooxygenase SsuD/methylene tetrahydromethanopterin reductase-like flavin-dependent oxidoreductase (luciferase family)
MNFGLFYYCQGRGVPHDQAYAEMLDQIALAETLGFDECWFAEHHFTDCSLLLCSFGNLAHEQVCRSLELFARAVISPAAS